jgi:sugar lactone lactonase YvrE
MKILSKVRRLTNHALPSAAQILILLTLAVSASATEFVGTDINSGKLVYIVTPKTLITITTTGAKPDGVVFGPNQEIIYTLAGAGEVHIFNPYTHTDTLLAKGMTTPVNLVVEPRCKTILVSDIGANKIFRITLATHAVTTFYNGPDKMQGLVYDTSGRLFVNDVSLNAIVQLDATGAIIARTPTSVSLTTLAGLIYDSFTRALFATSSTGQVLYRATTDLGTVTTISFPGKPILDGIVSDGHGNLFVVGGDGTNSVIYKFAILTSTQTPQNTVPGLDDIVMIPFGACIKGGTDGQCE